MSRAHNEFLTIVFVVDTDGVTRSEWQRPGCDTSGPAELKPLPDSAYEGMMSDSARRKATPIWSGVMRYFPDAISAVARLSKAGNDKHNPGQALHWARDKSTDHEDCVARHLLTPELKDKDTGEFHAAAIAWRALAQLQLLEEQRLGTEAIAVQLAMHNAGVEQEAA